MSTHRAPTQVTIASSHPDTAVHEFVRRYWRLGSLLAGVVTVSIVAAVWINERSRARAHSSWDRLRKDVQMDPMRGVQTPAAAVLGGLAEELSSTSAGPWAKALQAGEFVQHGEYDAGRRAADELAKTWPDHLLSQARLYPQDGSSASLVERLKGRASSIESLEKSRPDLFANPPLPDGSPTVVLKTSRGDVTVGLYRDRAPKHVENFIKLCSEGFYDGTKIHRVRRGQWIEAGDPNTKIGEVDSWGKGGPGYSIPYEDGKLWHFKHVLSSIADEGKSESNGSQFELTVADVPYLDGSSTVFGVVVDGIGVLEEIANAELSGDRPLEPILINSTEVK